VNRKTKNKAISKTQTTLKTHPSSVKSAQAFAESAINRKAINVIRLDVRELTSFTDIFVIATGTSDQHVRSLADAVAERGRDLGHQKLSAEGYEKGRWILLDFNDVVVHVFQKDVRDEYDLERMWSEGKLIGFEDH
jgi:ribosome-associated protein